MKKINFRKTLFAAVLLFQLNAIAAFGQTVVKGSVKDNTGKPISGVVVTDGAHFNTTDAEGNYVLNLADPAQFAGPVFHLFTGGLMLGAIFMATDYVTSPMTHKGMLIYGVGIGLLTVIIRVFGAYPEGMSFAILIMNGFTPLINRYCKPRRF